jgi:hypothetical protein
VAAAREGAAVPAPPSKYDMLPDLLGALRSAADGGRSSHRYDPLAELRTLAACPDWHGPSGRGRYCPMAAALDAAAGWEAPSGSSRYCPVAALVGAEAPEPGAGRRWDPLAWLLDGWAANSAGWEPEAAATASAADWEPEAAAAASSAGWEPEAAAAASSAGWEPEAAAAASSAGWEPEAAAAAASSYAAHPAASPAAPSAAWQAVPGPPDSDEGSPPLAPAFA